MIREQLTDFLLEREIFERWPELKAIYLDFIEEPPRVWDIAMRSCRAVCGEDRQTIPILAALSCLQLCLVLVDDIVDEDPKGKHIQIGVPNAINMATAFQAIGSHVVMETELEQELKLKVVSVFNRLFIDATYGENIDILTPQTEEDYWTMARTKSSAFYGSAFEVGAIVGGASEKLRKEIRTFGDLYGELIQIHDDLKDTTATPPDPDWLLGRRPLPILYAELVDHPEKPRFLVLRKNIEAPGALEEAQSILVRCGAISYGFDQLFSHYKAGTKMLSEMDLFEPDELQFLIDELIEAPRNILEKLGDGFAMEAVLTAY
jgi:geranylgeranyl pyrophosphate synthase